AAEVLGIPPERIRVDLGDSDLPPAPVSGGSMTTASVTPAVKAAAEDALGQLKRCAIGDHNSPLHGLQEQDVAAENGALRGKSASVSYSEALRSCGKPEIEATANVGPGAETGEYAFHSFGAQFSEARVDADTGQVTVTRHVAVFDAGRIINAKTARSQAFS